MNDLHFEQFLKDMEKEQAENRAKGLCVSCGSHPIHRDDVCEECEYPFEDGEITQEDLLEWMGIY